MNLMLKLLKDAGVRITVRELHARKPHELSLAEKWAVEKVQPGTFPGALLPAWLRPYITKG